MAVSERPVLVLGASGCVGRTLAAVWPADVPALWQHRTAGQGAGTRIIAWDILAAPAPDLPPLAGIVMLAGVTGADPAGHNAALAQAACDLGAAQGCRVLLASSQAVYAGADMARPLDETRAAATGGYGAAKLAMEATVAAHPHVDACCLRIANVIGCDMLLRTVAAGPVTLDRFADGTGPQRQYVGPATLALVIRALLVHDGLLPAVVNVAQPGVIAMADLLGAAGGDFTWQDAPATALPRMTLDLARLMALVPLPTATAASLIAEARAAGWSPA